MKISTKFYLSFWFMITFLIVVAVLAIFQVHNLYKITSQWEDYSALTNHLGDDFVIKTKNAAHDVHINVAKMLSHIKELVIIKDNKDLDTAKKALLSYEKEIESSFETIEQHFSGNKQEFDNVRHLFDEWKSVRNQVIALQKQGKVDEAMDLMFNGEAAQHINKLEKSVDKLHHIMDDEADNFLKEASLAVLNSLWVSLAMVTVLVLGGWLTFSISRHIATNVIVALEIADAFASGHLSDHLECDPQTETGQLLQRLDTMQAQLIQTNQEVEEMETQLQELEEEKRIVEKEKQIMAEEKHIAEESLRARTALDKVFGIFLTQEEMDARKGKPEYLQENILIGTDEDEDW